VNQRLVVDLAADPIAASIGRLSMAQSTRTRVERNQLARGADRRGRGLDVNLISPFLEAKNILSLDAPSHRLGSVVEM
jgi:hypothetical protein